MEKAGREIRRFRSRLEEILRVRDEMLEALDEQERVAGVRAQLIGLGREGEALVALGRGLPFWDREPLS
jgi:hypothetical protein